VTAETSTAGAGATRDLSLYRLLDPQVHADPYPLYRRLQEADPVHWDPYLNTWIVTRYDDVMHVLHEYSAARFPPPEQLVELHLVAFQPVVDVLAQQMLYADPPLHTRLRALSTREFAPRRVERLREHVRRVVAELFEPLVERRSMEVIADFARPLPAIVSCEMLGVPTADWPQLSRWTRTFAEFLGNFQLDRARAAEMRTTVDEMTTYLRRALHDSDDGVLSLLAAPGGGNDSFDALNEDETVANVLITLVGALETTTNLIGNGFLLLLRHPDVWDRLQQSPELIPSAVEEFLRYESPIQHTARLAPGDVELGGKTIHTRQAVIAMIGAANRDPSHFDDPDRFDIERADNRHLAFGWGHHFCFGAGIARIQAQTAFAAFLDRMVAPRLTVDAGDGVTWRTRAGAFRGLEALPVEFDAGSGWE
jgi:cytochrome P450